jgi:hypothetical protein
MTLDTYRFVRWLRSGLAADIETGLADAGPNGRAKVNVRVQFEGRRPGRSNLQTKELESSSSVELYGPADAVGLASVNGQPTQIIKIFPPNGSHSADPTRFAHVEFDSPDYLWQHTPSAATADQLPAPPTKVSHRQDGTLPPWLTLIAVECKGALANVAVAAGPVQPTIKVPAAELPDLSECHGWAHTQLTGIETERLVSEEELQKWGSANPQRNLSRLVCPRVLRANTRYLACVVPVFLAGRAAGLGVELGSTELQPDPAHKRSAVDWAWRQSDGEVRLPVYFSWEFTTGQQGDFETLVRDLRRCAGTTDPNEPCNQLAGAGARDFSFANPGWGLNAQKIDGTRPWGSPVGKLYGALKAPGADPYSETIPEQVAVDIADLISDPEEFGPPLYGRFPAMVRSLQALPPDSWLTTVNTSPAARATAGLGGMVVRQHQEQMMAAIWRQFGEIERANVALRQAQLATLISTQLYTRHVRPLAKSPFTVVSLLRPMLSRLPYSGTQTNDDTELARLTDTSSDGYCIPSGLITAAATKMLRPNGRIAKRLRRAIDPPRYELPPNLQESVRDANHAWVSKPSTIPLDSTTTFPVTALADADTAALAARALGQTASTIAQLAVELAATDPSRPTHTCMRPEEKLSNDLLERARPASTIPRRVRSQVRLYPPLAEHDPIQPAMVAPRLDTPMWSSVRNAGLDWLFPGLETIPENSIVGLETNQRFVEAFMLGLNVEIGREMLWRGFPTDQRGTVFRYFWDSRAPAGSRKPDIDDIHMWPRQSKLGEHGRASTDRFVIVIRGALLQRFPNAEIFLVQGQLDDHGKKEPKRIETQPDGSSPTFELPLFIGRVDPDITFLGFEKAAADYGGSPGWWLVIQEQPTEPCFGISDEGGVQLNRWTDLGVTDLVVATADGHGPVGDGRGYIRLEATANHWTAERAPWLRTLDPTTTPWDGRSENVAAALLRRPFRLYAHCSDFLPGG